MTAYYNEIDPYAAQWLRNLIAAGHIAPGVVDNRSIVDVTPNDLRGFTQCHFFAGVGVWSYALRRAGWPDDRPVWTGSCPCQPFSSAGAGAGFADERHLWPHWLHLIRLCRPENLFGEQVASKDGLGWLDLVQADLEGTGYACWPTDICAAGVGAPHIRQRLFIVGEDELADAARVDFGTGLRDRGASGIGRHLTADGGRAHGLGDGDDAGLEGFGVGHSAARGRRGALRPASAAGELGRVAHRNSERLQGEHFACGRIETQGDRLLLAGSGCDAGWLADDDDDGRRASWRGVAGGEERHLEHGRSQSGRPGPTNGLWGDADWLLCRDGKWRPVEPGTFPLAHGAASRVGRLRAYGNAIVAQAAQAVIETYLEHERDLALARSSVLIGHNGGPAFNDYDAVLG